MTAPRLLARLDPSPGRRILGVGTLVFLAILLGILSVTAEGVFAWRVVLVALGAVSALAARIHWRATGRAILLTEAGLAEADGRMLARMDEIVSVDRSTFAAKPSNGFLVRLSRAPGRAWAPGLWWRVGTRLGIGGVTRPAQGRAMADILALHLAEREGRFSSTGST